MASPRKSGHELSQARKLEKAWKCVGRFLWSFANISSGIEEAFTNKFSLDAFSSLLMQHHLDIRKKIELLKYAFERQGIDDLKAVKKALDQVHRFHDIRNAIAHSGFEHVDSFIRVEKGHKISYPAGVQFDFVDRSGKLRIPDPFEGRKKQKKQIERLKETYRQTMKEKDKLEEADGWADWLLDERTITYAQFDEYDTQMSKLMMTLFELDPEPINEGVNFVRDVAMIIASSDNVLPFPSKR